MAREVKATLEDERGETPYLIYDCGDGNKKPYFASDWVFSHLNGQDWRIDHAEYWAWGAFAVAALSLILAVVAVMTR